MNIRAKSLKSREGGNQSLLEALTCVKKEESRERCMYWYKMDHRAVCWLDEKLLSGAFKFISETDGRELGKSLGKIEDAINIPT